MENVRKDASMSGNWLSSAHFQNLATSFNTMMAQNTAGFGQYPPSVRKPLQRHPACCGSPLVVPFGALCHSLGIPC